MIDNFKLTVKLEDNDIKGVLEFPIWWLLKSALSYDNIDISFDKITVDNVDKIDELKQLLNQILEKIVVVKKEVDE